MSLTGAINGGENLGDAQEISFNYSGMLDAGARLLKELKKKKSEGFWDNIGQLIQTK